MGTVIEAPKESKISKKSVKSVKNPYFSGSSSSTSSNKDRHHIVTPSPSPPNSHSVKKKKSVAFLCQIYRRMQVMRIYEAHLLNAVILRIRSGFHRGLMASFMVLG